MKIGYLLLVLSATTTVNVVPAAAQTQPQILAELFCSFGCNNCPTPDSNYYGFVDTHPSFGVVIINYHNTISDLTDMFYLETQTNLYPLNDRSTYYRIPSDPTGYIDGDNAQITSQSWENMTTQYHTSVILNPINPTATLGTDSLIHITFSATGPSSGSSVVRVALKESNIDFYNDFTDGYGNPPGDIWNNIFRTMLPNSSDTTPLAPGETRSFDVAYDTTQYQYSGDWNTQNMEAVVFVQDVATDQGNGYDVESLGVVSLASAATVAQSAEAPATFLRVAGIPSNPELIVSLPVSSRASIAISDMLGRVVRTIPEVTMPAGQTSVDMSGSILPTGCYFARLVVDGNVAGNAKFIVAP